MREAYMPHRGFLITTTALVALGAATTAATTLLAHAPARAGAQHPAPAVTAHAHDAAATEPASRRAFFGELHLHTVMSFDAWTFGTRVTPDQAY
ncbi:MAG: DUF3604 domain-containing protein, partial [Proteobacteria bacterium]|nr:DUF3604 domain-containing protein [Pseudomonadota bacterium]